MTARGLFIVLEGPEGSGKSTLAKPLAERMREHGRGSRRRSRARWDAGGGRSPGRRCWIRSIRSGTMTELFLYLAARAELVATVIAPALRGGRVVLSDRFTMSTEAYQMAGRGTPGRGGAAGQPGGGRRAPAGPDADLDLPPRWGGRGRSRAGKRLDRLDAESAEFHRRVHRLLSGGTGRRGATFGWVPGPGPALAGGLGRGAWRRRPAVGRVARG